MNSCPIESFGNRPRLMSTGPRSSAEVMSYRQSVVGTECRHCSFVVFYFAVFKGERMSDFQQMFRMISIGAFAGLLLSAAVAAATGEAPNLIGPPQKSEDVVSEPSEGLIECGRIVEALRQYNELHYENGDAIAGYVEAIGTHMYEWNDVFVQLENKTVTFRKSYFEPVLRTAETNDEISEMIFENTDQLSLLIENIIESLESCL